MRGTMTAKSIVSMLQLPADRRLGIKAEGVQRLTRTVQTCPWLDPGTLTPDLLWSRNSLLRLLVGQGTLDDCPGKLRYDTR